MSALSGERRDMIKTISLLHARAGMAHDAFLDRYEGVHVPLVNRLLGPFRDYRRNFVRPAAEAEWIAGLGAVRPDFDAMTAIWFDDQAALAALGAKLAEGDAGPRIAADEIEMFDRSRMAMFMVGEQAVSGPAALDAAGVKLILIGARDPGLSREDFVARCDADAAHLAGSAARRGSAALRCNHLLPGGIFDLGHIEGHRAVVDFDFVLEARFADRAAARAFLAEALDPSAGFAALRPVGSMGGIVAFLAEERR